MSLGLSAFALAFCATRAIRGMTSAGQNVWLSPRESIKVTSPQIVVSLIGSQGSPEGRDIVNVDAKVILRVETFVPFDVQLKDQSGILLDLGSSSSGELVLCVLWNQIVYALQAAPGAWPDLFRQFAQTVKEIEATSTVYETDKGTRVVGRSTELKVTTLSEPVFGRPATGAWASFLDALTTAADPESMALEGLLRGLIERNTAGPWQPVSASFGIDVSRLGEIGSGTLDWLSRPRSLR